MPEIIYIGIDDTDILGGPGTGKIARGLGNYLESADCGVFTAVIRHQLLVDPRIPYTSHNSSKCVLLETYRLPEELLQPCIQYMTEHFQEGSDPGLCIVRETQFTDDMIAFGCSAREVYVPKHRTIETAAGAGILLKALGGTGDGVIGAFAAAALSISGNDGRYVQLRGIKEIEGRLTVAEVKERTATVSVVDEKGNELPDSAVIDSLNWLRPSRINKQPVLRVRLENDQDGTRIWRQVERKHRAEKE